MMESKLYRKLIENDRLILETLTTILKAQADITSTLGVLMTTLPAALADVQTAEKNTQAQIAQLQQTNATLQTALTNGIATLTALLGQGTIQPSDLEAVVASMKADAASIQTIAANETSMATEIASAEQSAEGTGTQSSAPAPTQPAPAVPSAGSGSSPVVAPQKTS